MIPPMIAPEIAQHLPGIRAICKRQGVERMSFFGSAAREDFSPETSDVDCLIKFLKINKPGIADRYFNLIEGLEKTCHRPVDIVFEGTMKNYIFQKIVEKSKVLIYDATNEKVRLLHERLAKLL